MKLLTDNQFLGYKTKADEFDKIVNTVVESSEGVEASSVTADTVIGVITTAATALETAQSVDNTTDLVGRIEQLEADLLASQTRVQELEKELDQTPGATPATITSTGEPSAEKEDILAFATKNAGDPFAVLAEAEKQGYL